MKPVSFQDAKFCFHKSQNPAQSSKQGKEPSDQATPTKCNQSSIRQLL